MQTVRKWVLFLVMMMFIFPGGAGASMPLVLPDSCDDGVCPVPTVNEENQPVYAIVFMSGCSAIRRNRRR